MRSTKGLAGLLLGVWAATVSCPARASATITFDGAQAQRKVAAYVAFLERHSAKYASELATVGQLERSEVEYRVRVGGDFRESVDGELTTDGERVLIHISDGAGANGRGGEPFTRFSERACLAHELEHARQFDDGEFAFERDPATGRWHAHRPSFDISDERRAWEAQLRVSNGEDFWRVRGGDPKPRPSLLAMFAAARTDAERENILRRNGYGALYAVPNCAWAPSAGGFQVGALVRPDVVSNVFGRIGRAGASAGS
jgi:hypothetical protein